MTWDWNSDRVRDGADRRATVRLMYYWLSLRRIGTLPAFADFDPRRNPVRWEICFLLSLPPDRDPVFEHVGEEVAPDGLPNGASNRAPNGAWAADAARSEATRRGAHAPDGLLGLALDGLDSVRETALPYRRDGSAVRGHRLAVRYRSILLPFADLSGGLRYVLGAVSHCLDTADPPRLVAVERAGPVAVRAEDRAAAARRALAS